MKQFIYLDTDIVNSIIAQEQKGIIVQESLSKESVESESRSTSGSLSGNVKAGISFWKLLEAVGSININKATDTTASSSSKNVIDKVLHDAAFDIAFDYIEPKKIIPGDQSCDEEGNYILLRRVFDFVDLEYLEALFSQNGIISYIKKTDADKIREEMGSSTPGNREQNRNYKKEIEKEIKKIIDLNNKRYDEINEGIAAIRSLIPYSRMLISSDGYLIPLENQYFRIDPKNLGFKYGGEINCVGMITNIIGEDTNPNDENNIFATIQFYASEALRSILPTKENNICVIHPIAIYYGE